jgi:hypothetical protein
VGLMARFFRSQGLSKEQRSARHTGDSNITSSTSAANDRKIVTHGN